MTANSSDIPRPRLGDLSLGELFAELKPGQLWSIGVALVALITSSFGVGVWARGLAADRTQDGLKRDLSEVRATLDATRRGLSNSEEGRERLTREVSAALAQRDALQRELQRLRSEATRAKERGTRREAALPESTQNRLTDRTQRAPSKWQDYEGFDALIGRWEGKIVNGPAIELEVPFANGDEVTMSLALVGLNCSVAARLARATEMFSASEFYFKPTTIGAACPNVDYIIVTPVLNSMNWQLVSGPGKSLHAALKRRI